MSKIVVEGLDAVQKLIDEIRNKEMEVSKEVNND